MSMSKASDSPAQPYALLRIKRKRNEEPLDALVVESRERRKKTKGGIGVFQFAHTIEEDAWDDEKQRKVIQDQISRLARDPVGTTNNEHINGSSNASPSPVVSKGGKSSRRYTILAPPEEPALPRHATSPPTVLSSKSLASARVTSPDFRFYDVVPSKEDKDISLSIDPETEKFMPLLNDYLKLHDIDPATSANNPSSNVTLASDSDEDYVWDVFYHRPATLSEWNAAARVGTLTGPLPSDLDPYDSLSDEDEEEDEADEDSNAEEYYKNDYPDEEDSSSGSEDEQSDEWHEDSEYDDIFQHIDAESDESF